MNRSKKKAQRIHARRRAMERFGLNLTEKVRSEIIDKIRNNESQPLERSSPIKSIHAVRYDGEVYAVVYDKRRKELASLLPREYLDRFTDELTV